MPARKSHPLVGFLIFAMGDHDTLYTVLMPEFWARMTNTAEHSVFGARHWQWMMFVDTHYTLLHVAAALIAVGTFGVSLSMAVADEADEIRFTSVPDICSTSTFRASKSESMNE